MSALLTGKRKMRKKHCTRVLAALLCTGMVSTLIPAAQIKASGQDGVSLEILFDEPVSAGSMLSNNGGYSSEGYRWQQLSLPIGNSLMGASIYGEVDKEQVVFNHKTLWNGGPSESRPDYNGGNIDTVDGIPMAEYVAQTAQAFLSGSDAASAMCSKIVGSSDGYGAYQAWGNLYLDFDRADEQTGSVEIIDDRDARVVYSGSWSDWAKSEWETGTEKYTYDSSASFTLTFEGTGIAIKGATSYEMGQADIYVDDMNTVYETIDMYSASTVYTDLFSVQGLDNGTHTLKFVNKENAGRAKVSLDLFEVTKASGTIVDLNPANTNEGVVYSSDWAMWDRKANGESDADQWVNGDEMYCQNPTSETSITYTFNGTGIALYGAKNSPLGQFNWSLDGQSGMVDCYADSMQRQELLYVSGLSEGEHTLTITSNDNTKLSFDNFVVYNNDEPTQKEEHTETTNYTRKLSLDDSLASVEYDRDNTHYTREYLASSPDNVIAIKLAADGEKDLDFDLSFPMIQPANTSLGKTYSVDVDADAQSLTVTGHMNDNQLKFAAKVTVLGDGTFSEAGEALRVQDLDEAVILLSASTDYKDNYPEYRTGESDEELLNRVSKVVEAAGSKGYEAIKKDHLDDYHNLFDRVTLDLGQTKPNMTNDELLAAYKNGTLSQSERRYMEVLLFQYGRYLLISSSRETDSLPANLQGVWNIYAGSANDVPWGSDYHMNVNLQMNYWPAYSTNLSECALPLIDYVDNLREPGRVTASTYFGIDNSNGQANGFSAHTQNTPFGWTCPGWSFSWGWSPAAVPWILQNVYEYYEYTNDVDFLIEKIFPMLEEEAKLYEQILTEVTYANGKTRLATVPAYSPEHGPYTAGNVYENSLVWQLFNDCIEAAQAINEKEPGTVSEETIAKWEEIKEKLDPIEIGDSGQIKEWYDETTLGSMGDKGHRHLSHLLGLFPGDLINSTNPEYLEAAKISLNDRGDQSTGWAMAQRINSWARLKDGNRCLSLIETLFKNGIYANMWDTHTPFQIDGNFGYTSGVAEMLMQSNTGVIELLPALPDAWSQGSFDGLVARGNFEVALSWKDGAVEELSITSNAGETCVVSAEGLEGKAIYDASGKKVSSLKDGNLEFETEEGQTYTLMEDGEEPEIPVDPENPEQPEQPEAANKSLLLLLINTTEGTKLEDYVNDNGVFEAALNTAKEVFDKEDATQEEVDEASMSLNMAWMSLRLKPNEELLKALADIAGQLRSLDRTKFSAAQLEKADDLAGRIEAALADEYLSKDEAQALVEEAKELESVLEADIFESIDDEINVDEKIDIETDADTEEKVEADLDEKLDADLSETEEKISADEAQDKLEAETSTASSVKTSTQTNTGLYIGIAVAAVIVLALVFVLGRKKKK